MNKILSDLSLFHTKVKTRVIVRDSGCHEWTGKVDKKGYGRVRAMINGKVTETSAHRLALYQHTGIQRDDMVLHSCDNRICCNPEHLRYGSPAENYKDMVSRERRWVSGRSGEDRKTKLWLVKLMTDSGYTDRQIRDTIRISDWTEDELSGV